MRFVPCSAAPNDAEARYVVFRDTDVDQAAPTGRAVLVGDDGTYLFSGDALTAPPSRRAYVGQLDDRPLYVTSRTETLAGAGFTPLRAAMLGLGEDHFAALSAAAQVLAWDEGHRFCSRCGRPVAPAEGERAKRCAPCHLSYYPRIAPCVIVLVHDGDRVLLAHKPRMPFFALVAGFVEPGESLEEAVAREVAEETGLTVADATYFGSQTWPFPHQIMVGFFARYESGAIAIDERELDEVKWFDRGAMPPVPPTFSIAGKMIEAWIGGRGPIR